MEKSLLSFIFSLSISNFITQRAKDARNGTASLGLILTNKEKYVSDVKVTRTMEKTEHITLEFITAKEENTRQHKTSILDCLAVQRKYKDAPEPEILKWKIGQKIKPTIGNQMKKK